MGVFVCLTPRISNLRRFTGVEFAVTHSEPPTFFIIQKRERLSPDEGELGNLPLQQPLYISACSSPYGRLFHNEQPHLPVSRPVHCAVEPFGKSFGDFCHFLTRVQLDLAHIAFVAPNLT